jgi:hypothetical protein
MTENLMASDGFYMADTLRALSFVQWDRFTEHDGIYTFYGRIDREQDSYKDFVVMVYEVGLEWTGFTTSSAKYTEEIYRILFGNNLENHADCIRVEDHFDIPNCIRL